MTEIKAGFVGLGAMGWAMAGHLQRVGLLAGVANRSAAKAQAFAQEHGVLGAATPSIIPPCRRRPRSKRRS